MSFDPIDNGWRKLLKDGRVASFIERSALTEYYEILPEPNEEMGGLCVAIVEGTFSIKETDDSIDLRLGESGILFPDSCQNLPVTSPMFVGNKSLAFPDEENTGEYFLVIIDFDKNASLVVNTDSQRMVLSFNREYREIVPIDPKYLPDMGGGGQTVIDLTQYADKNFYGQSLNAELLTMVAQGLAANGALQTKTAAFNDSAFFDALSTENQLVFTLDMGDDAIMRFNPTASCLWGGKAQLYSFSGLMMQGYTAYELKVLFFFVDNIGTEMEIHVLAKPVA